jgi:ribosomal protein S18 acetylase RimI-like enzyme
MKSASQLWGRFLHGGYLGAISAKTPAPKAMQFRIREALASDEPFLREMLYQSLHVPEGCAPFDRQILEHPDIAKYVEGWGQPGDLGFIALEANNGEAIAAAWVRLFAEAEPGYGYVDSAIPELSIAVLPEYRNRGIGSALIRHLFTHAQAICSAISLSVSLDNPARRLYERLGFEQVRQDATSVTMLKQLSNDGIVRP